MATLTFFTVTGVFTAAAADTIYDEGNTPELVGITGSVRVTPLVGLGATLKADDLTPPSNLKLTPLTARIKKGVITTGGVEGIRLVANTDVLNLEGDLYYRVEFFDLVARGQVLQIDPYVFEAPATDLVVDLVEVAQVVGEDASVSIRGPRGPAVTAGHFIEGDLVLENADGSLTSGITPADGTLLFVNNGDGTVSVG